jgi:hypothetical protein
MGGRFEEHGISFKSLQESIDTSTIKDLSLGFSTFPQNNLKSLTTMPPYTHLKQEEYEAD